MKNIIKNSILYIFFITGAVVVLLNIYCIITDTVINDKYVVFQILGANTLIIFGLKLTSIFESTYAILECFLDTGYIILVLAVFGLIFDWYSSIPVWSLIIMGVLVYIIGILINIPRSRKDLNEINRLLKKRKEKKIDIVT